MTTKLAISLPDELAEAARVEVRAGRADSVSAYVAEAMRDHQRAEALASLVRDLKEAHGKPSDADYAWADEVLGLR